MKSAGTARVLADEEAKSRFIPARWWNEPEETLHASLDACLEKIRDAQTARKDMYKFFAELYGGQELSGLGLADYDATATRYVPPSLPHNVVRNMIETVVARVAKERPLPQVTTSRGNHQQRKKGRKMTTAIEGSFEALKVFQTTRRCARDAATFGPGVAKIYREGDEPRVDRVFPWELYSDIADARYGTPRSIFHLKWYDKAVLAELVRLWRPELSDDEFADIEQAIYSASSDDWESTSADTEGREDQVLVREAWHLRSSKRAKDGRHAITIPGKTLLREDYERDYFPFAFLNYKDPLAGMWGEGVAAEAAGYQIEINMVSEMIRKAHYAHPMGVWLQPNVSGTLECDFGNSELLVIKHAPGYAPQHIAPNPLHPQQYQYLADLRRDCMNDSGVSQMSAFSQKPPGIIAAKALNTLDDNESQRFALFSANWSQFHCDIAQQICDLYADIAAEHGDLSLRAQKRRGFVEYKWSDIALASDEFVLQTFPTSLLGRTPSARLQVVYDLFNAKVIDRALFLKLLDAPDVEAETDLETASTMIVDEQIEFMLDADDPDADGVYQQPEPFLNLTYALHRAQQHYCLEKMLGTPRPWLELLQQYMKQAKLELDRQHGLSANDNGGGPAAAPPAPPPPPGLDDGASGAPLPLAGGM